LLLFQPVQLIMQPLLLLLQLILLPFKLILLIMQPTYVSAIACLQEPVLHLICLLYTTTDALTDVFTKCVFYVPDIIKAMYTRVDICNL
jgi:hypothetical protein